LATGVIEVGRAFWILVISNSPNRSVTAGFSIARSRGAHCWLNVSCDQDRVVNLTVQARRAHQVSARTAAAKTLLLRRARILFDVATPQDRLAVRVDMALVAELVS
jgi:hypothetical protein